MDDLISRQAVIDLFEKYQPYMAVSVYEFGMALKALPSAQPEPKWISCSERQPEKADSQYWVCTDTGYQCQCRWTDNVYGLGSNGEWAWKIFDIPQYSHVIAWMPLPEPYKGDDQNE